MSSTGVIGRNFLHAMRDSNKQSDVERSSHDVDPSYKIYRKRIVGALRGLFKRKNEPGAVPDSNKESPASTKAFPANQQKASNKSKSALPKRSSNPPTSPDSRDKSNRSEKTGKPETELGRRGLPPRTVIRSAENSYVVLGLVGSGGFGDVYRVEDMKTHKKHAMKVEFNSVRASSSKLKMEVIILNAIRERMAKEPKLAQHFLTMTDKGMNKLLKFVIMTLSGPNIDELRKNILQKEFSAKTATRCARQCLDAIIALHKMGFLHLDVKPQNFVIGAWPQQTVVYLLDFGMSCPLKSKCQHGKEEFFGTIRYASRNMMKKGIACPRDDLESWLFTAFELYDTSTLPWKGMMDAEAVLTLKERIFTLESPKVFEIVPQEFKKIVLALNKMTNNDRYPNYGLISRPLNTLHRRLLIDGKDPYEWSDPSGCSESDPSGCSVKASKKSDRPSEKIQKKVAGAGKQGPSKTVEKTQKTEVTIPTEMLEPSRTADENDKGEFFG
ncbi:hypothetical protein L596_011583 [Steinernema carpocapsae]|uniref:non-specific serine/threonine protein kinase n=1 Tax=Steinernema carpocapsae TaxID=34508 RepID=A0A4U5NUD4_STECR|nr:hypothetical protein L596_011583 [Steinernema carpocapsae]